MTERGSHSQQWHLMVLKLSKSSEPSSDLPSHFFPPRRLLQERANLSEILLQTSKSTSKSPSRSLPIGQTKFPHPRQNACNRSDEISPQDKKFANRPDEISPEDKKLCKPVNETSQSKTTSK